MSFELIIYLVRFGRGAVLGVTSLSGRRSLFAAIEADKISTSLIWNVENTNTHGTPLLFVDIEVIALNKFGK
jgi:hypothetical protein